MVSERFVLDASVTAAWCFRNESSIRAIALLEPLATRDQLLEEAVKESGVPLIET